MIGNATPLKTRVQSVTGRIGVVDIGSNTVRLVVYDVPDRMPVPMFNEKAECRLVEGLSETGKLSEKGIAKAMASLGRFVQLAEAMRVDTLDLIATAAVREASDGAHFVQTIESTFKNITVRVLSGAEEAELSSLGLLVGVPNATGLLGDLGGGSLDLVTLENGKGLKYGTLPLGHVRLRELADAKVRKANSIINEHLDKSEWLQESKGKDLYLAGGVMRALSRVFIGQMDYPLHIVDQFSLRSEDAERMATLLAGLSASTLKKIPPISPSRVKSIPFAAATLAQMIRRLKPNRVVFSGYGMREGQMLKRLPTEMRAQDPLIAGAMTFAERTGRFSLDGAEVAAWVSPLFPGMDEADKRRILAACLLSDIGWNEHPDYRAEHAFYRCLRLPFAGLTHADRVFIATSVYVRYNGDFDAPLVNSVQSLLEEEQLKKVDGIGRAIRLAHTLSGSAPGLLSRTRLERKAKTVVLQLPGDTTVYQSDTVARRFKSMSKALGLRGSINTKAV